MPPIQHTDTTIRRALPADAAGIAHLSEQLGYPQSVAAAAGRLEQLLESPSDAVFVAANGNEVLGWLHIFHTLRLESGVFAEIGGMVVDEARHGHGIGGLLVEEARKWTLGQGIDVLRVRSNVQRVGSHHFYRSKGFRPVKQQQVYEWRPDQDGTAK